MAASIERSSDSYSSAVTSSPCSCLATRWMACAQGLGGWPRVWGYAARAWPWPAPALCQGSGSRHAASAGHGQVRHASRTRRELPTGLFWGRFGSGSAPAPLN